MTHEAFALSPIAARAAPSGEADYEAIREAFMETARGRWFLAEYAKRNRHADTRMVERHYGHYLLYVLFYPQLVSGPIERASHFMPQLRQRSPPQHPRFSVHPTAQSGSSPKPATDGPAILV